VHDGVALRVYEVEKTCQLLLGLFVGNGAKLSRFVERRTDGQLRQTAGQLLQQRFNV
jgi:hypothetical protein